MQIEKCKLRNEGFCTTIRNARCPILHFSICNLHFSIVNLDFLVPTAVFTNELAPFHPDAGPLGGGVRAGGVRWRCGELGDLSAGMESASDQPLVAARSVGPAAAALRPAADRRLARVAARGGPARRRLLDSADADRNPDRSGARLVVLVGSWRRGLAAAGASATVA